jgi:acetyl-CoA synthetase
VAGKLQRLSWAMNGSSVESPPFFKWFEDGTLNASYNCLDRNVAAGLGDKVALIFEADDGTVTRVTYKELLARTCRMANALKARGVKKGDRVVIYMSMSVEGVVAMQACARIGAPHSVVFGGFSAQSLRDRIEDTGAVMVITADEQQRGGKSLPLKAIVDDAIALGGCDAVKDVIVYKRTGGAIAWTARDHWLHELTAAPPTPASPSGSAPSTRCSCSTPRAPPASPRACSTPPAATCCTRRSPRSGRST